MDTTQAQLEAMRGMAGVQFSAEDWDALNKEQIDQFRANQGKLVEGLMKGLPTLLLTTTGARTGKPRLTPLTYTRDGDRFVVLAAKLGAPHHPSWYHNLVAQPIVTIEVGTKCLQAKATVTTGNERDRLYVAHIASFPNYEDYQCKTERVIPVVSFDPMAGLEATS